MVRRSQEIARATMYNSRKERGNAMPTTSHFDARLTYDDLARIPEDGLRHEIIDGVHHVTPAPALRHQQVSMRLGAALAQYLEVHPIGEVLAAPVDTVLTRWDVVEPDLVFIGNDQRSIMTESSIQGAPALVVEILSPATKKRDLGVKKDLFDREGVREYWIVDSTGNTVTIHRRAADGTFPRVQSLPEDGSAVTTPLLPGFSLRLDRLFRP